MQYFILPALDRNGSHIVAQISVAKEKIIQYLFRANGAKIDDDYRNDAIDTLTKYLVSVLWSEAMQRLNAPRQTTTNVERTAEW